MNLIDAVIFSGVLTVPVRHPVGSWLGADRSDRNAFSPVMKRWMPPPPIASLIPDPNRISARGVTA